MAECAASLLGVDSPKGDLLGQPIGTVNSSGFVPQDLQEVLSRSRLPALDGLRAVAVFVVIVGHFGVAAPADLGVSAFFVLSGFLITWLLLKEQAATGTVSLRRFYLRRTLRIFPAYYAFLAFSIAVDLVRHDDTIKPVIVPGILYLVNYYNALHGHPPTSIAHAWSLSVEEQFYLLWPLGFTLLAGRGRRSLTIGLVVSIAAVLIWRSVAYYGLGLGTSYVYNAFDTRFDNLAVGCLLAVVGTTPLVLSLSRRAVASPLLPLLTVALLLISRLVLPIRYHYGPGFTVNAVLLAIFIVQMIQLSQHRLWAWLEHPVVRYLGVISYPLYLYHQWGLGLGHQARSWPVWAQFILGVCCAIALASGSYFVVERPFLRLKQRLESHPSFPSGGGAGTPVSKN